MKKVITFSFLIVILFFAFNSGLFAEEVRLRSVTSEEKGGQLIINFTFDKPTQFISYTLREPPRVILKPVDDTYTDLADPLVQNELISTINITKVHAEKIVSISAELTKDVPYYLVENQNVVSLYLTPQPAETREEDSDSLLAVTEIDAEKQAEEAELKRVKELNKLIAPTRER